jgi:molybdopterin molybdotransferase
MAHRNMETPLTTEITGAAGRNITVDDARRAVLTTVASGPKEMVPLTEAVGRVLAEAVVARETLWPFARAAMDGIAVRSADVSGAGERSPVRLRVVGAAYSGEIWPDDVAPGTAIRIATGTPVPRGADAVIPREVLHWYGERVDVTVSVPPGRHVFPAGEDARAGETVLRPGVVLAGGHIGLLAALGYESVPVVRRPVVAVLATGDELVSPSSLVRPGQVRESNSYALAAEVAALGAIPRLLPKAADRVVELDARIAEGLAADALVICGGASVGERDLVQAALSRAGVTLRFSGVAMKPGAPVSYGTIAGRPVFSLPGTPGAARVAFEVLVVPALKRMMGHARVSRPAVRARLAASLAVMPGRHRFLWAAATFTAAGVSVGPLEDQGTATLRSASDANALIELGPDEADLRAGARVTAHLLAESSVAPADLRRPAAVAVVGARGAGKTTLIERLVPALRRVGLKAAAVKHHVHAAGPDVAGTDTGRYGLAGAAQTVLAGPGAIIVRYPGGEEPDLDAVLETIEAADLILVEGYSRSALPKIVVMRDGVPSDRPDPAGPIVAVVGPPAPGRATGAPVTFDWDQIDMLAAWCAREFCRPAG